MSNDVNAGIVVTAQVWTSGHWSRRFCTSAINTGEKDAVTSESGVSRLVLLLHRGSVKRRGIDTQGSCGWPSEWVAIVRPIDGCRRAVGRRILISLGRYAGKDRHVAIVWITVSAHGPSTTIGARWRGRSVLGSGAALCREFRMNEAAALAIRTGARHPERLKIIRSCASNTSS